MLFKNDFFQKEKEEWGKHSVLIDFEYDCWMNKQCRSWMEKWKWTPILPNDKKTRKITEIRWECSQFIVQCYHCLCIVWSMHSLVDALSRFIRICSYNNIDGRKSDLVWKNEAVDFMDILHHIPMLNDIELMFVRLRHASDVYKNNMIKIRMSPRGNYEFSHFCVSNDISLFIYWYYLPYMIYRPPRNMLSFDRIHLVNSHQLIL